MLSSTVSDSPDPMSRYGHTPPGPWSIHGPVGEPGFRGTFLVLPGLLQRPFPAADVRESNPELSGPGCLLGFSVVGLILDGGEVDELLPAVTPSFSPGLLQTDGVETSDTVSVKVTDRHAA